MAERYVSAQTESKYAAIRQLQSLQLDATLSVGAEANDVINVAIQLKNDKTRADLSARAAVRMYLSDDANGDSVVATAPSGAVATGTDGVLHDIGGGSKKVFLLISEADGDIDVNLTESGAKTLYMILVMPNGRLIASGPITFA